MIKMQSKLLLNSFKKSLSINLTQHLNTYSFSSSIFKKINQENDSQKRSSSRNPNTRPFQGRQSILSNQNKQKVQRPSQHKKQQWIERLPQDLKQFKQQHTTNVKNIDKINKHFLGRRVNTKYKTFYNEITFQSIGENSKIYRVDDLPFNYQQKQSTIGDNRISKRNNCKRQQYLFEKISEEKLKSKMYQMAEGFFNDIIKHQRTTSMQPNFERHAHSVLRNLIQSSYQFEVVKEDQPKQKPQSPVFIKDIYFLKGVTTFRNNNYSVDSYKVSNDQFQQDKVIQYTLWKNQDQRYPEKQWEALKNIVVRFQTVIDLPFIIDIIHPNRALPNVGRSEHQFVFEMDMVLPPKYSEFRLNQEEYSRSYRVNLNNLTITDVDSKNPFFAMSYKQSVKENALINKIV